MNLTEKNRKYVLAAALVLALAAIIWWNTSVQRRSAADDADLQEQRTSAVSFESIESEAVETGTVSAAGTDYFKAFREERESVRALEIEYLDEIISTAGEDSETLTDAQQQKLSLVNSMEAELTVENLIRAKGFRDVAVTFHSGTVNVIVDTDTLSEEQVAQILDIVLRETGETAENVKVIPAA